MGPGERAFTATPPHAQPTHLSSRWPSATTSISHQHTRYHLSPYTDAGYTVPPRTAPYCTFMATECEASILDTGPCGAIAASLGFTQSGNLSSWLPKGCARVRWRDGFLQCGGRKIKPSTKAQTYV